MEVIEASPRFLALLDELERFQLPPRSRILPGEIVGGRIKANLPVIVSGAMTASPPAPVGAILAMIAMRASARDRLTYGEIVATNAPEKLVKRPCKAVKPVMAPRQRVRAPKPPPGPKKPRSAEAIASAAAKVRAQRQARKDALLPLIDEARAKGCVLFSEICHYLDQIGYKPHRGTKWSKATLSNMLADTRDDDRTERDVRLVSLIGQARNDGATTLFEVADWLNARGHRSPAGKPWKASNVSRFERAQQASP